MSDTQLTPEQVEWQSRSFTLGVFYEHEWARISPILEAADPAGSQSGREKAIFSILVAGMVIGMEHKDVAMGVISNMLPEPRAVIVNMARESIKCMDYMDDKWGALAGKDLVGESP